MTDPVTECHETVIRTFRFPVRADTAVHKALIAADHVQREPYNRAIESHLAHRGRVDPLHNSPVAPHGLHGQRAGAAGLCRARMSGGTGKVAHP